MNNATDHANSLKKLSDFLQSLLRDPNKYAEKALQAARSYENVVKAIEELLKLAREANDNSKIALDLVSLVFKRMQSLREKLSKREHIEISKTGRSVAQYCKVIRKV